MPRHAHVWLACFVLVAAGCEAATPPTRQAPQPPPTPVFDITPRAAAAAFEHKFLLGLDEPWYVRLTVTRPPGARGPEQTVTLDPAPPGPDDYPFLVGGVRGVVAKKQVEMLRGSLIDYSDAPDRPGFVVTNANLARDNAPGGSPAARNPMEIIEPGE